MLEAAAAASLANVRTMDLSAAFNGHRLCEKGVGLLEEVGLSSWKSAEALNKTEWINGGSPRGGTCTISAPGLNAAGEPNMSLH